MSLTKQMVIWALAIILGGGLISLAVGSGFFGVKALTPPVQARPGQTIPTQGPKCDPTRSCSECHAGK